MPARGTLQMDEQLVGPEPSVHRGARLRKEPLDRDNLRKEMAVRKWRGKDPGVDQVGKPRQQPLSRFASHRPGMHQNRRPCRRVLEAWEKRLSGLIEGCYADPRIC